MSSDPEPFVPSDRVAAVESALDEALADLPDVEVRDDDEPLVPGSPLRVGQARGVLEDGLTSRALDVAARRLKAHGLGHYTISSAGHEANVLVGALLAPDDPCLLHYRSGALVAARARAAATAGVAHVDVVVETLRSLVADRRESASGGRHKVWGHPDLRVLPQTSTIASHLPKATGLALALDRAERLGLPSPYPSEAIVCASLGDASLNHASALAGLNAAAYGRRRGVGVPLLVVVEDNGIGISTPTPSGWVAASAGSWPHVGYHLAAGELDEVAAAVAAAITEVRTRRAPVVLHLPTTRLWGHAGSDVEAGYRSPAEIRAAEAADPLPGFARRLVELSAASGPQLVALREEATRRVVGAEAGLRPVEVLRDRAEVLAPLAPHDEDAVRAAASAPLPGRFAPVHTGRGPGTLAAHLRATLDEELARRAELLVLGQDVGRKGGVYGVTAGLAGRYGAHRVIDTLLDETSILGAAQGAGLAGQLPVAEVQYLAYLHNALDQLRGEAASTSFLSAGRVRTPVVVRAAAFADPHGFGGHFHNDHAVAALREIPGLALAVPSRADDGARLLRTAVAMAAAHGRVVVLLEPTALYHRRDLHEEGDDGLVAAWTDPSELALPGTVRTDGPVEPDVLVVTYGVGVPMALRVARQVAHDGVGVRVLDLRWLAPLPLEAVRDAAATARRVLVVDPARGSGGVADALVAGLVERGGSTAVATLRAADSYVPIGPAAEEVLVREADVLLAVRDLAARTPRRRRRRQPDTPDAPEGLVDRLRQTFADEG